MLTWPIKPKISTASRGWRNDGTCDFLLLLGLNPTILLALILQPLVFSLNGCLAFAFLLFASFLVVFAQLEFLDDAGPAHSLPQHLEGVNNVIVSDCD